MKTVLVTGSTDGIGLEAAKLFAADGRRVLLHGRNRKKLQQARLAIESAIPDAVAEIYLADLADLAAAAQLAEDILSAHGALDAVINNAGVYGAGAEGNSNGLDLRFLVNTLAPFILTCRLLPALNANSRVVNLSSAAQAPVDIHALEGRRRLADGEAYAQSKLALTMWTRVLAEQHGPDGPIFIAVNPGSMLGSKMVKESFGVDGADLSIGADILRRAAFSAEFADASGRYFDNDRGAFASPHRDAFDADKVARVMASIRLLTRGHL